MRLRTLVVFVVGLTSVVLAGCHDWLTEVPEDFFSQDNFPASEADLRIALGGIDDWYTGGQSQAYFHRGWPMLTEVPSDQTVASATGTDSRAQQDAFTLNPSNEWLWRVWRQIYGAIGQANFLIARIPQMTSVSQDVKDRYLGATKFHRAFNHFNAVRVWGSVPLMLTPVTDFSSVGQATRAPIADVYAAIVADLQDAARLLPRRWPDSAPEFMGTFASSDARKSVTFLTRVNVPLGCTTGATGCTTYRYDSLPGFFGDKRPRFPSPMPYYGKFFDANGSIQNNQNQRTDLNWPIYRYAEVLLMFAEAENEANGPANAYQAINAVRARAQLLPLAGLTQDQFRSAVHQERSWDLAFESKRVFDLKRWGEFYSTLQNDPVAKIGIKDFMVFLPIPQREIDLDPALGQNPGY